MIEVNRFEWSLVGHFKPSDSWFCVPGAETPSNTSLQVCANGLKGVTLQQKPNFESRKNTSFLRMAWLTPQSHQDVQESSYLRTYFKIRW